MGGVLAGPGGLLRHLELGLDLLVLLLEGFGLVSLIYFQLRP